jgi:hypothetical protein
MFRSRKKRVYYTNTEDCRRKSYIKERFTLEKKKLKASGQESIAKMFDGKVMVQTVGVNIANNGASLRKDCKVKFAYDLLSLVHEQLVENSTSNFGPKTVRTINENNGKITLSYALSIREWVRLQFGVRFVECLTCVLKLQKDQKGNRIVLMRY